MAKIKILIIEADQKTADVIRITLRNPEYAIDDVPNAETAWNKLNGNGGQTPPYHIVVSDYGLNGTRPNGFELLERMRASEGIVRRIHFVLLSNLTRFPAPDGRDIQAECAKKGAKNLFRGSIARLPIVIKEIIAENRNRTTAPSKPPR